MTPPTGSSEPSATEAPWADLLDRHRERWAAGLLQGRPVVDLASTDDPVAALAAASDDAAVVWLDGYLDADGHERLREGLAAADRRKLPIVVGFETDREGLGARTVESLRATLGDAQVVVQELAAGSLIGPSDEAAARGRSVHVLVCANLAPDASSELHSEVEPLMTGYVAWLEQANRELRAANTRLGRERLGVHDAAAAAVEDRRVRLEEQIAELEQQLEQQRQETRARQDALLAQERALQAPRYRFVDALRALAFTLPGVSLALRLRSRRVRRRWDAT